MRAIFFAIILVAFGKVAYAQVANSPAPDTQDIEETVLQALGPQANSFGSITSSKGVGTLTYIGNNQFLTVMHNLAVNLKSFKKGPVTLEMGLHTIALAPTKYEIKSPAPLLQFATLGGETQDGPDIAILEVTDNVIQKKLIKLDPFDLKFSNPNKNENLFFAGFGNARALQSNKKFGIGVVQVKQFANKTNSILVAGAPASKETMQPGDSGGPIFEFDGKTSRATLRGVTMGMTMTGAELFTDLNHPYIRNWLKEQKIRNFENIPAINKKDPDEVLKLTVDIESQIPGAAMKLHKVSVESIVRPGYYANLETHIAEVLEEQVFYKNLDVKTQKKISAEVYKVIDSEGRVSEQVFYTLILDIIKKS